MGNHLHNPSHRLVDETKKTIFVSMTEQTPDEMKLLGFLPVLDADGKHECKGYRRRYTIPDAHTLVVVVQSESYHINNAQNMIAFTYKIEPDMLDEFFVKFKVIANPAEFTVEVAEIAAQRHMQETREAESGLSEYLQELIRYTKTLSSTRGMERGQHFVDRAYEDLENSWRRLPSDIQSANELPLREKTTDRSSSPQRRHRHHRRRY